MRVDGCQLNTREDNEVEAPGGGPGAVETPGGGDAWWFGELNFGGDAWWFRWRRLVIFQKVVREACSAP